MINKRSLWFMTLFSLILVLGVYYITMPSEMLLTNNNNYNNNQSDNPDEGKKEEVVVSVKESEILTALRASANEEMMKELGALKMILTDVEASVEDKNNAFEKMKHINSNRGLEEKIEKKVQDDFKLKSFIKVDGDQIRIVVASESHDNELANNIMRTVQGQFDKKMYISVKFQK